MLGTAGKDDSAFGQRKPGNDAVYVVCDEPDALFAQATAAGAEVVRAPPTRATDRRGHRPGPGGNLGASAPTPASSTRSAPAGPGGLCGGRALRKSGKHQPVPRWERWRGTGGGGVPVAGARAARCFSSKSGKHHPSPPRSAPAGLGETGGGQWPRDAHQQQRVSSLRRVPRWTVPQPVQRWMRHHSPPLRTLMAMGPCPSRTGPPWRRSPGSRPRDGSNRQGRPRRAVAGRRPGTSRRQWRREGLRQATPLPAALGRRQGTSSEVAPVRTRPRAPRARQAANDPVPSPQAEAWATGRGRRTSDAVRTVTRVRAITSLPSGPEAGGEYQPGPGAGPQAIAHRQVHHEAAAVLGDL